MNPVVGCPFDELESGLEALHPEPAHQWQRNQKPTQRKNVGDPADSVFVVLGDEQKHERAHQRREENDGENVVVHFSSELRAMSYERSSCACSKLIAHSS